MADPVTSAIQYREDERRLRDIGTSSCCGNCLYWDHKPESHYGRCRINPPVLLANTDTGVWPATRANDYCYSHWLTSS